LADPVTKPRDSSSVSRVRQFVFVAGFALTGVLFEWSLPWLSELLMRTAQTVCVAADEDDASFHLIVYFGIGAALSGLLWGWIGSVAASSARRALGMAVGVVVATAACASWLALRPCSTALKGNDVTSLLVWAGLCALSAGVGRAVAAKLAEDRPRNSD